MMMIYKDMKYIGLIIDPWCVEPIMKCIGEDGNNPIFFPNRNINELTGLEKITDQDRDTKQDKYTDQDRRCLKDYLDMD